MSSIALRLDRINPSFTEEPAARRRRMKLTNKGGSLATGLGESGCCVVKQCLVIVLKIVEYTRVGQKAGKQALCTVNDGRSTGPWLCAALHTKSKLLMLYIQFTCLGSHAIKIRGFTRLTQRDIQRRERGLGFTRKCFY